MFDSPGYQELWDKGSYAEAVTAIEKSLKGRTLDNDYPGVFLDRAKLLESVGRYDDAIKQLEAIVKANPADPAYTTPLVLAYLYRGRMDEFHKTVKDALAQDQIPARPASLIGFARLQELSGENPKIVLNALLNVLMKQLSDQPGGFVAAGDLAYRTKSYEAAAEYYNKALALDAKSQDALAGLAECYAASSDPRIEDAVAKLTAINPHHPRAIALAVNKALDLGDVDPALKMIGEELAVNPNNTHFLALKAAALFLKDDTAGQAATETKALAFNPVCAEVYSVPGGVASRHYRFAEACAMLRKAVKTDPDDHDAKADLAFNLLRIGEQTEGRKLLDEAFKADPFNVQAYNLLQVMDSIAKFKTIQNDAFQVQLPEGDARILGHEMLGTLQQEFRIYQSKYDVKLSTPVLVQMFDVHDQFMVRSIGLPGNTGHLGICFGQLVTLDSPRARVPGSSNWRDVMWHEFVHVITLQKTKNRMPRWLSEGISVYEETQGGPGWGQKMDPSFKPILAKDGWPKTTDLERYFTQPKTAFHLLCGYFLAGEFIHCYIDSYGAGALNKSLDLMAKGVEVQQAMESAAGVNADAINAKFKAFLEVRCATLKNIPDVPDAKGEDADDAKADTPDTGRRGGPRGPRSGGAMDATAWFLLKSPFTDAVRDGVKAASEEHWDVAEQAFIKANELYPDYTGEAAPLRQLAHVYEKKGDKEKELATLRKIVRWDPTALAECRRLTDMLVERKSWDEAIETAQLAFNIDPFDIANLKDWHISLIRKGNFEDAVETAGKLAYIDKAREADYALEHARLLALTGEGDKAKEETVSLLEKMPYYWDAQDLLLNIVDKTVDKAALKTSAEKTDAKEAPPVAAKP